MPRDRIGIVGAGRLGCSIAIVLNKKGYTIAGVYSKSIDSQEYLCSRLKVHFENNLVQTVKQSDVIFIAVPDSSIADTADAIARVCENREICGKFFFHLSGALTSDELLTIRQSGGYTGSFHPIQTVADRYNGWKALNDIYFGYEGCEEAKRKAEDIAGVLNSRILNVKKEDKPLYHAAACIVSNYTVTLSYMAGSLLEKAGIDSNEGIKAFIPLMENTLGNVKALGSIKALTGPVSRGDIKVIEGHLKALSEKEPGAVNIYKALGLETTEIALVKGTINEKSAEGLRNTFR